MYLPETNKVRRVRCVKFTENVDELKERSEPPFGYIEPRVQRQVQNEQSVDVNESRPRVQRQVQNEQSVDVNESRPRVQRQVQNEQSVDVDERAEVETDVTGGDTDRYPKRERHRPKHLADYVTELDSAKNQVDFCYRASSIPRSYHEAMSSSEACKGQKAMDDEIHALDKNETFELTPLPEGKTLVGEDGCMQLNLVQKERNNIKHGSWQKGIHKFLT